MAEQEALLRLDNVTVRRDGRAILREVSLSVRPGSVHAVLGLNGSGKSTLAYTLIGSAGYAPASGRILFDGKDITALSISERGQRGMTLAWQEPARFEGLSVERYLRLGMRQPDDARLHAALDAVALTPEYLERSVDEALSGGERKRVELAAVYAMQPRLAILDEPDSGIDALTLDDIAALIRRMADEGATVLVISHRDEVVRVADAASLICEGQILRTGAPADVCDRYARCCRPCLSSERVDSEVEYERL